MSFRTDMLGLEDSLMASLMGPNDFNVVVSQLSIITQTWSGTTKGAGTATVNSTLTLGQYYPLRQLSAQEVANSGGRYRQGDVIIEDITPSDGASVGYTPAQLDPARAFTAPNQEVIYRLTGELAGDFELREARTDDAFAYALVLRFVRRTP